MNNKSYWEQRISRIMREVYNSQETKNIALLQGYKKSLRNIKIEISGLYEKIGATSLSEAYKHGRLAKIEEQLKAIVTDLGGAEQKFFDKSLSDNYIKASNGVVEGLSISGVGVVFNKIDRTMIDKILTYPWSGADYSSRIWHNKEKLLYTLKETLTRGLIQGTSLVTLSKELNNKMNVGACESLRLIRTEAAHIVNTATIDRYKESGVVDKVMWCASYSERTCPTCGTLHGQEFILGKEPSNPNHPNCKCCWVPIVK